MLGAGNADAQRRARAAALPATTPDEAFVQARQFAQQYDAERFEAAAARAGAHPLGAYLDYWRLRLKLSGVRGGAPLANGNGPSSAPPADVAAGNGNGQLDAALRDFLQRHDGTVVADQLRRDWLQVLGRRGDWAGFDQQYPQWIVRDDAQIHCWHWLGRVQRGQPLPPEARDALFQPRELGEACGTLFETLVRAGTLTRADAWLRTKLALEVNAVATVRRLAPLLGMSTGATEAALQRPAKVLGPGIEREVAVIASAQLARQDPDEAAERIDALRELPAADRAFVKSQIAAHSMRRLSPKSLARARESLDANASDETWVWLARAALRESDWRTLHAVVGKMSAEGRRDPTWVYWHARAHRALGRPVEADAELRSIAGQYHFYGQLAAEEFGELTTMPPRATAPTEDELAEVARNDGFARALKFYSLGLRADGNREWNFQLRGMSDRQLLAAANWACQRSVLDRCVNTADRTRAEHDFALRFITPFRDELAPVAAERGLDPAWIYGLIRQESRFVTDARSSASAHGLMQIIPPTARWIATRLGVKDFRVEQLGDLDTNLRFGTFYLKSVLDDLDGSPVLASAGYNAGPNRPRNWRSSLPAAVEGAVFAEIIPFSETRDYVKKVLSNATFYSVLFSGQPQSLKLRLGTVAPAGARPSELP